MTLEILNQVQDDNNCIQDPEVYPQSHMRQDDNKVHKALNRVQYDGQISRKKFYPPISSSSSNTSYIFLLS